MAESAATTDAATEAATDAAPDAAPETRSNASRTNPDGDDKLHIGDYSFDSRLLIGSSSYPNPQVMLDALTASGAELVTVAIRRVNVKRDRKSVV